MNAPTLTAPAPELRRATIAPAVVDASWLAARLGEVRVIDTRRTHDYLDGHVPGACSFSLDALLVEDTAREALTRLARAAQGALAARGIAPDDHVVLVDDSDGSAALGAVVCELAGVMHVSMLRGGIGAWVRHGQPLETQPSVPAGDTSAWPTTELGIARVASFEDVVDAVAHGTATIIDARSQLEHEGIVGAPCCATRGAIPGSVHLEWTAFFDIAGAPHEVARIREIAAHVGLTPDDDMIVMCHAGHRASVAANVLRAAGFTRVRVALGSWHEWSAKGMHDVSDRTDG